MKLIIQFIAYLIITTISNLAFAGSYGKSSQVDIQPAGFPTLVIATCFDVSTGYVYKFVRKCEVTRGGAVQSTNTTTTVIDDDENTSFQSTTQTSFQSNCLWCAKNRDLYKNASNTAYGGQTSVASKCEADGSG